MARPYHAAPAAAAVALALGACSQNPLTTSSWSTRHSYSERECLARAMYFESNRSSEDGMAAVGTVVMNRLQSGRYPKTVCGVVGQHNQFADGVLSKSVSGRSWQLALGKADAVLAGERHDKVGGAMFFHTAGYTFPYRNMAYVVAAGGNVFYEKRQPGTFTPVHPNILVAQADRPRARPSEQIVLARAEQEPTLLRRPSFTPRPAREEPVRVAEAAPARPAPRHPTAGRLVEPDYARTKTAPAERSKHAGPAPRHLALRDPEITGALARKPAGIPLAYKQDVKAKTVSSGSPDRGTRRVDLTAAKTPAQQPKSAKTADAKPKAIVVASLVPKKSGPPIAQASDKSTSKRKP